MKTVYEVWQNDRKYGTFATVDEAQNFGKERFKKQVKRSAEREKLYKKHSKSVKPYPKNEPFKWEIRTAVKVRAEQ